LSTDAGVIESEGFENSGDIGEFSIVDEQDTVGLRHFDGPRF